MRCIDNARTVVYVSGTQHVSASIIMDDISCIVCGINELIQIVSSVWARVWLINLPHCR